ncbi:hypothetical protein QYE76_065421 [Lolium multiflorum]|uniref:CCHC-type domain-containing protein n=1 Tax=Lolium multiflorum TaxID=4521 RepID=A0AAD8S8I5_LOLMU|nr:hypothetical protein QYE76_065421 [Lolium multiflorum]
MRGSQSPATTRSPSSASPARAWAWPRARQCICSPRLIGHLTPSPFTHLLPSTSASPWTSPTPRRSTVAVFTDDDRPTRPPVHGDVARQLPSTPCLTAMPVVLLMTPGTSLRHLPRLRAPVAVATIACPAPPRPPRASINRAFPRAIPTHHHLPLLSLTLLDSSPSHIIASSHLIASRSPVALPQKPPSNSSTSGAPTTTAELAVVDNVQQRQRRARRSSSTPSTPYRRRASTSPLVDLDDARAMEYQWECYQLGHGGELKFEKDLKQLVEYLGHPYPEFFGTSFNNQLGGSPRWEVSADLGRKLEAPMAPPNRNANQDAMMQLLQTLMTDREDQRAERQANLAALQQIAQNNQGHGNHDHSGSKLKNFQNTNPPMFSKTEEPLDADDWLQTMENNLEVAGVEAAEKVLFATHYLSGPARAWWTSACAMNAGQMMNWEDFKLKFSKYHVPQGLIKKMRDEFRELKQGRMSVVEYRDKFLTLSRYAPDETDTNEKRKERFLNGLHDEMQTVLVNIPMDPTMQKHRNNSTGGFTPRHNRPPAQTYRPNYNHNNGGPPKPGGNHNHHSNNNSHPNNNNNHPHGNNNNPNTGPKTGSNAIPVTPKDKSTVNCYECGVVGHYSNECPKKLARLPPTLLAQQQRRAGRRNQNNKNGRLYHIA